MSIKQIIGLYYDSLIHQVQVFTKRRLTMFEFDLKNSKSHDFDFGNNDTNKETFSEYIYGVLSNTDEDEIDCLAKKIWEDLRKPSFDLSKNQMKKEKLKGMTIHDYVRRARDTILAELDQMQNETLDHYEKIKDELLTNDSNIQSKLTRVFEKRFPFILKYKENNLYEVMHLIELDFPLNLNECQLLSYFINQFQTLKFDDDYSLERIDVIFGHFLEYSIWSSFHLFGHLKEVCINQDGVLVYFLAKYLYKLFMESQKPVRRVVRITRQDLILRQTEFEFEFNSQFSDIDLTQPESSKIDFSNLKYLSLRLEEENEQDDDDDDFDEVNTQVCFPIFKPSSSLEFLNIKSNRSSRVLLLSQHFLINLGHIRLLQLDNCDFSLLPSDAFKNMKNLEALGIKYPRNFAHIEIKDLFKLKRLRLKISKNEIPRFDEANPNLQVIDYAQTSIWSPSTSSNNLHQVFKFGELRALSLSGHNFYFYDIDFDLNWLIINNSSDSTSTNPTSSLRYLSLTQFKSIKGSFSGFVNLRTLVISSINFQPGMFNELVNLKRLDISCKNGKDEQEHQVVPIGLFDGLVNLEQLDINGHGLKLFPDGLFLPLFHLQCLNFHTNKAVNRINANTFKGLEDLKELGLGIFEDLSIDVFSNFKNLKKLTSVIFCHFSEKLTKQLESKFPNIQIY